MRGDTVPRAAGVGGGGGGQPVLLRRDVGSGAGRQGGGGVYHRAGGGGSGSGIVTRRRRRPSSFPFSSADARRTHALAAAPRAIHSCGVRLPSFGCVRVSLVSYGNRVVPWCFVSKRDSFALLSKRNLSILRFRRARPSSYIQCPRLSSCVLDVAYGREYCSVTQRRKY